ncbi:unnamed protein product [Absidia cylindrospora]
MDTLTAKVTNNNTFNAPINEKDTAGLGITSASMRHCRKPSTATTNTNTSPSPVPSPRARSLSSSKVPSVASSNVGSWTQQQQYHKPQYQPVPPPPLSSPYYHFTHGHHQHRSTTATKYIMASPSRRQQQQQPSPPGYYHSNNNTPWLTSIGWADRTLLWLYDAADRVVHARAPESPWMASFQVDDLLLLYQQPLPPPLLYPPPSSEKGDPSLLLPPPPPPPPQQQPPLLLQGQSLSYFSSSIGSARYHLWKHIIRSRNYELFMLMILVFHWSILACHPIYTNEEKTMFHGHWHEYTLLLIQVIYTLDCLIKILVYGLWIPPNNKKSWYQLFVQPTITLLTLPWKRRHPRQDDPDESNIISSSPSPSQPTSTTFPSVHHKAYLSSFGNVLDCIAVICYWIDLGIMLHGYKYCSVFKAMAATRPLRLLSFLPGTAVILKSLETGWDLMLDVSGFLFFFMFLFAMVGLISFRGVFSRQCYHFPNGPDQAVLVTPPMFCSGYYAANDTIIGPFDVTIQANTYPGYQGLLCPRSQQCIADPSTNTYMNFDMIFSAFLNVYTFVSMELWTDMMYITQDADSRLAALFYCLGVYIIGFILIYLLLAVITSAFARVRATSGSSSAFTQRKSSKAFTSLRHHHILQVLHPTDDNDQDVDDDDNDGDRTIKRRRLRRRRKQRRRQSQATMTPEQQQHEQDGKARRHLIQWKRRTVACVQSKVFFYFGGGLVALDTLFMCLRSVYAGESMLEFLDNVETAFTFLFAIEIVIRMMGALNWLRFWSSFKNKLDLFLVIVTCVIQLPMIQDSSIYMYLTIFQILRMYRLFLCIPRLEKLLNAALGTGESVMNVVIFLLLSTALFAPIFMQMFGGDFVDFIEPNDDRLRFDTFWQSFLALIMIYTSETWTGTLYDGMQSQLYGGAIYASLAICLYFAFAKYIVAGLYVAVILENFELDDDYIRRYQIKHFIRERLARQKDELTPSYYQSMIRFMFGSSGSNQQTQDQKRLYPMHLSKLPANLTATLSKKDMAELLADQQQLMKKQQQQQEDEETSASDENQEHSSKNKWVPKKLSRFVGNVLFPDMDNIHISKLNQGITKSGNSGDGVDGGEEDYDLVVAEENRKARESDQSSIGNVKSLLVFSETNPVRKFCKRLVGSCRDGRSERHNGFNWFIMACVLVSILVVILDEPSTRKLEQQQEDYLVATGGGGGGVFSSNVNQKTKVFEMIDMVLGVIFVVEMVLRVIADGLVLPPRAYLRHAWNRLDFVVILLNFGTLFADNNQLPRALGTVRSMRVLRLIRYFGGVRDVFIDLFHAFPLMMDAMLLTFLVMIPFSVYGVNIFGGRFWTCNDTSDGIGGRLACMNEFVLNVGEDNDFGDFELNILVPRTWQNPGMNLYTFDDFPVALRHLFSLTSTEGWVDSMFYAMSTPPENDLLPVFDWTSPMVYHSIFYVAFMIISHGTVQLFVGVIIEKFKQRSGITTLTFAQRQYVDLQRQLAELKPTIKVFRPATMIRGWCHDLVGDRHSLFNRWMMIMVVLNMVVIASEFNDEPFWLSQAQDYAYFAFAIVYVLEVIVKFLGLGRKKWWQSKWNIYDACIAVSSMSLVIARFVVPELWSLRAERYCLVFAAFRIGEGVDALQTLYHTIAMAMPSIIRVSAVFMLVMCLFAMIFMEFFGLTKYGPSGSSNSNFRNYGNALLLLVRMTTGEGWNEVMMDYTFSAPNCVASDNYLETDCGSANWAYFLFNFFYITCTHIFLNLFIAVVISNFEYTYETRSRFTLLTKNDLRKFKYAWAEVDPAGTGFIQKKDVAKFFKNLTGRFQVSIYDQVYSIKNLQKLSQQKPGARPHLPPSNHHRQPSYATSATSMTNHSYVDEKLDPSYYNYDRVNQCLAKMDTMALEQRRKAYNLLYMEICDADTSKGIAFSDVLHIMAFRFVDIEQALTLHPLMDRLEKLDQFNKTYAAEKARGVFLTLIQRKRYLRQLWQKRNQVELDEIALASDFPISPMPNNNSKLRQRYSSPVPTIRVEKVQLLDTDQSPAPPPFIPSPHPSDMADYHGDSGIRGTTISLPGSPTLLPPSSPTHPMPTSAWANSPYSSTGGSTTDEHESISPAGSPLPLPLSPGLAVPPTWMYLEDLSSTTPFSVDQAQRVMQSLESSPWSSMLYDDNDTRGNQD